MKGKILNINELKAILSNRFFTKNGNIKTAIIHKINIGYYPEWKKSILFYSSFLEENVNFNERIYCILNNIKESFVFQKNILGEKTRIKTFKGFKKGYVLKKKPHKSNNIKYTYNYNPKNKSELKKYIKEFAFDKNGVFFTQKVQKEINIVNKILEYTNNLPKSISLQERAYWIMNNISSFPVCKECGKKVRFGGYKYGYSEFCSDKCCGSNHTKENRKNNKYIKKGQSFEKFYGEKKAKEIKRKILENKEYDYSHLRDRRGKTYEEIYGEEESLDIKNKQRLKAIDRTNFAFPVFNKKACQFFNYIDWKTNTCGQHALTIKGEKFLKKLGYWLDYINNELKIIIEWDEEGHYNKNGKLNYKDILRQREIQNYYPNYKFIRVRQKKFKYNTFEEIYTNIIEKELMI
jgi:very-short-patch-repair endonuclease